MSRSMKTILAAVSILVLSGACVSSLLPSSSPDAVSTIVAATMQAISTLSTQTSIPPTLSASATAVVPTSTPLAPTLPVIGPTASSLSATRINFLTGATTGVASAPIQAGQVQYYVARAEQGQPMLVSVDSLNQDVTLSIKTQGGTSLLNSSSHQTTWQGTLPQTEDYYLTIYGGASTENFTLTVTLASRIKFPEGMYSTQVSGKTVAGYSVAYTVFAIKNQKMTVNLNGVGSDGALTIYGYSDGQPYLHSVTEQTSFTFQLPATQDYIIEVVPRAGQVIQYTLTVKIQ
jgi:hypothetical protein